MDNNNLQEEIVVDESRRLFNILNFQDFVQEEGKKEVKKNKLKVKSREEHTNDMEDDSIDPNDNPDRFVKLREQFIKENYKQRVLAGKQAPFYYPFFQIDHPSKEGGFSLPNGIARIDEMLHY